MDADSVLVTGKNGEQVTYSEENGIYRLETCEDNEFTIRASDNYGHEASAVTVEVLRVTKEKPVITVGYFAGETDRDSAIESGYTNRDEDVLITIARNAITDAQIVKEKIKCRVNNHNYVMDYDDNNGSYTVIVPKEGILQGENTIYVYACDTTGNETQEEVILRKDTVAPHAPVISVADSEENLFRNIFNIFRGKKTLIITAVDDTTGIDRIEVTGLPENMVFETVSRDEHSLVMQLVVDRNIELSNISAIAYDSMNNASVSSGSTSILFDKKAPEVTYEYLTEKTSRNDIVVKVTIRDEYLDYRKDGIHYTAKVNYSDGVTAGSFPYELEDVVFEQGSNTYTGYIHIGKDYAINMDGVYTFEIVAYDEAENATSSVETEELVYDTTAPDIHTLELSSDSFTNVDVVIKQSAEDTNTGVYGVYYSFDSVEEAVYSEENNYEKILSDFEEYSIVKKADTDFDGYCHIWAVDAAGNRSEAVTIPVQIDVTAPSASITPRDAALVVNADYSVGIAAQDGNVNGVYSGIAAISYSVTSDGVQTQSGRVTIEDGRKDYSDSITIDAAANSGGTVMVTLTVTDRAGNTSTTQTYTAGTDVSKPVIQVSYDNNNAVNTRFFNQPRTATITITERNFDENKVKMEYQGKFSGWSNDGDVHTATILYDEDADYTFHISCTDGAGNESEGVFYGESVMPESFTVDLTYPVLSVVYDNNYGINENYYNTPREAVIEITEHNFNQEKALEGIVITAEENQENVQVPHISGFVSDGDTHRAVITFAEDAHYSIHIHYTDEAENTMADYEETFVIDKTPPVITIEQVANRMAYNGDVIAPVITVTDNNYNGEEVYITLTGTLNGNVTSKYLEHEAIGNGERFVFNNIEEDDLYSIQIAAVDKAGNQNILMQGTDAQEGSIEAEKIEFAINRNGSVYTLDGNTTELVEKGYVNAEEDVTIVETNVNILNKLRITLSKDNATNDIVNISDTAEVTLQEGDGYRIDREEVHGGWSQYTYIIDKKNFSEDGIYRVTVYSVDKAGNISENTMETKLEEVVFAVDKTKPKYIVSDLEDGKTYAANEKQVSFEADDNLLLCEVKVYVNEVEYASWNQAEIEEKYNNNEAFTFTINESNSEQTVKIVCTDAAGNVNDNPIAARVYVTTNQWIRFINNRWAVTISILLLLLLLIVAAYVATKNSKKE